MAALGITMKSRWRLICIAAMAATSLLLLTYFWPMNMDADNIANREIAKYASRHSIPLNSCKLVSKEITSRHVSTFDYELGDIPRHDVHVEVAADGSVEVSRMIDQ